MEFQINFGIPGLVVGFFLLGWLLGWLDRKAAAAEIRGDLGQMFIFFLPAAGLIQPGGSIVELAGGSAIGWITSYGWRWAWQVWSDRGAAQTRMTMRAASRRAGPMPSPVHRAR
jgi:hypothetical protein